MKLFWIIMGFLIAGGVAFLALGPSSSPPTPMARTSATAHNKPAPMTAPVIDPAMTVASPLTSPPAKATAPLPPDAANPPDYPHPDSIADALISGDWTDVSLGKPDVNARAAGVLPDGRGSVDPVTTASKSPTPPTMPTSPAAPAALPPAVEPDRGYAVAKGLITKKDDGTLLIDDRLVIKGDGSESKPYEITWDLLTSAEQTYDPRNAKKKIPEGVALLDGKRVRIKGYVAFPLYVQQPREVLAMLNQWDGCCIGVPPTPYDAIEVRLAKPVTGNDRYASSGVVEGTFAVKPYVTGNWLVGLYVIDGAVLKPEGFGSAPATHGQ